MPLDARPTPAPIVLSDEEVAELYRYTLNSYISPTAYPALHHLLGRVSERQMVQP